MALTDAQRVTALVAAIEALTLPTGTVVEEFSGDEYEENADAVFPHISVAYVGARGGELLEQGGPVTYETIAHFDLYLAAETQADVLALLWACKTGLAGYELDPPNRLEWANEELVAAPYGYLKWAQGYTLTNLVSQ